jgi:uncharacterized protein with NRDE domain
MCTIVALHRIHPEASLVIAANRDEFYAREATGPMVLDDEHHIVGGRDLQAKGTWLGVTPSGLFVAVTNQRTYTPPDPRRHSRGELVLNALRKGDARGVGAYLASLDARTYNPFNLLFGDGRSLFVAYAREQPAIVVSELGPGVIVLANDRIGAEAYPKTQRAEALLTSTIASPLPELLGGLRALLGDHNKPPLEAIAAPPSSSLFNQALLRELQALCIHTPLYGTRSSSIVALNPGRVDTYFHADGPPCVTPFRDVRSLLD